MIFLILCIILPGSHILYQVRKKQTAHHKQITQAGCELPPSYPQNAGLLGFDMLWDTFQAVKSNVYLQKTQQMYDRMGKTFTKSFLGSTIICTIEPENIKSVLSSNFKHYGITDARKYAFRPFLGQNILLADGAEWTHARATLRPSFTQEQTGDLGIFETHVANLVKSVYDHGCGCLDLKPLFLGLTADIATESLYGRSIGSLTQASTSAAVMEAFEMAQWGCEEREGIPSECYTLLEKEMQNSHYPGATYTADRYILMYELAKTLPDKVRLRDELLTVLFAGRDTTASLLSSFFFTLARKPDVWCKLRMEVEQLDSKKPTLKQLMQMRYFIYCLNETLRLYPPLPHNARVALEDTILPTGGGANKTSPIFIPAGTKVEFHASALHRCKDLWGRNADEFQPERWDHDGSMSRNFLAFSAGPRSCIGQRFGFNVALYTAVRMVQAFETVEAYDHFPWTEHLGIVCFPKNGVKVSRTPDSRGIA